MGNLDAIIFVPALAGCIIFGFVFALFAAHHYLTVLQNTGSGAREIHWASEPILDHFWKVFYLAWLIGLWLGPAYFLGRALSRGSDSVWLRLGVPLAVFWVCYPVSQLSSLSGPTIWLPLHPGVFARLAQKPAVTLGFMALSAGALLVLGAGFHWVFFADGILWLFIGCPVFVIGGLLYGRLLGRLAYALAFTRPFLARKKKKKPKPHSQPRDETDAEQRFVQPSDLQPIDTPDEGPLTGYDVKFDNTQKVEGRGGTRSRKRVLAEAADPDDEPNPSSPEPVSPVHSSSLVADEEPLTYGVNEPEVQSEERTPAPVVKPREDEMRLLSRDDAPKPPNQVWSAELVAFLGQPGTIAVIAMLSGMCLVVGGMVRIARAFNPVAQGG